MDDDIAELLRALETAWNELDPAAFAALFVADALYVTRTGIVWRGRPAIEEGHARAFAGTLGELRLTLTPMAITCPAPGVCVATIDAHLTDTLTLNRAITTLVLTSDGAQWCILSAQITDIPAIH